LSFNRATLGVVTLYHADYIFFFDLVLGPGKTFQQYVNPCFRSRSGFNWVSGSGLGTQVQAKIVLHKKGKNEEESFVGG
jgi:hypothetical protein